VLCDGARLLAIEPKVKCAESRELKADERPASSIENVLLGFHASEFRSDTVGRTFSLGDSEQRLQSSRRCVV